MSSESTSEDTGLRGIVVANTKICLIDETRGELSYRGYDIHELAENSSYEEVAYLLLYGTLPRKHQLNEFSSILRSERTLPTDIITALQTFPKTTSPMDVLQSTIPLLAAFDDGLQDESKEANCRKATCLLAKLPTIVATWERLSNNVKPVRPDKSLSHAANFLYMLKEAKPDEETARAFDVCLILHAEHSFNASTFAARVVASTRAHMYASVAAAVGALSGSLHGGANAQVMRNLLKIGELDKVEAWVKEQFDQNQRVMGMGHAVYKTLDPRADVLKHMAEKLARRTGDPKWYLMTRKMEETTKEEFKDRKGGDINPNVDLYSASVYYMMGISPALFTPVFAISRVAGWSAHVLEEKFPESPVKPMLYRPTAGYTGNYCGLIGCKYVPLNQRT